MPSLCLAAHSICGLMEGEELQGCAILCPEGYTVFLLQEALRISGGHVDCLVNNAGVYYPMSLEEGPNKGQGPLDGMSP